MQSIRIEVSRFVVRFGGFGDMSHQKLRLTVRFLSLQWILLGFGLIGCSSEMFFGSEVVRDAKKVSITVPRFRMALLQDHPLSSDIVPAASGSRFQPVVRRKKAEGGESHTCWIIQHNVRDHKTLACTGRGDFGQLGINPENTAILNWMPSSAWPDRRGTVNWVTSSGVEEIARARTDQEILLVAAGGHSTCVIFGGGLESNYESNQAYCFGDNRNGQLGINQTEDVQSNGQRHAVEKVHVPRLVVDGNGNPLTGVRDISISRTHTCFLHTPAQHPEGMISCAGRQDQGQMGVSANLLSELNLTGASTPVYCSGCDGTVSNRVFPFAIPVAFVDPGGSILGEFNQAADLSVGEGFSCALFANSAMDETRLFCMGARSRFQAGPVSSGVTESDCGLRLNQLPTECSGYANPIRWLVPGVQQGTQLLPIPRALVVESGLDHSCAIVFGDPLISFQQNTVYCWGGHQSNQTGKLIESPNDGVPNSIDQFNSNGGSNITPGFRQLHVGDKNSCALQHHSNYNSKSVVCYGETLNGFDLSTGEWGHGQYVSRSGNFRNNPRIQPDQVEGQSSHPLGSSQFHQFLFSDTSFTDDIHMLVGGDQHYLVKTSGQTAPRAVFGWGRNAFGQMSLFINGFQMGDVSKFDTHAFYTDIPKVLFLENE